MAESYSNLYKMRITGLGFHCLWALGQTRMALAIFTRSIIKKNLFQFLTMAITRDFTYIDDIVDGIKN